MHRRRVLDQYLHSQSQTSSSQSQSCGIRFGENDYHVYSFSQPVSASYHSVAQDALIASQQIPNCNDQQNMEIDLEDSFNDSDSLYCPKSREQSDQQTIFYSTQDSEATHLLPTQIHKLLNQRKANTNGDFEGMK